MNQNWVNEDDCTKFSYTSGLCKYDPSNKTSPLCCDGVCCGRKSSDYCHEGWRGAGLLVCHPQWSGCHRNRRWRYESFTDGGQVSLFASLTIYIGNIDDDVMS